MDDQLTLRLNFLPLVLLVRVEKTETACRAYWGGHLLGTIGQTKAGKLWGYRAADDGSGEGSFVSRGSALKALWVHWEVAHPGVTPKECEPDDQFDSYIREAGR